MNKISQWLERFLSERGIKRPTGEPIYSYHISEKEFCALSHILRISYVDAPLWDACFVIYACEWWRRNYDGGHRTWDPILKEANAENKLNVLKRSEIVGQGLKFWKRSVFESKQNKSYLGTIALESGIPTKLLKNSEHYITELIKRTYYELGSISSMEEEYFSFIENEARHIRIPVSLQQDDFYALIGGIVSSLADQEEKYDLSNQENPVDYLDTNNPNWRDTFPIRVDTSEAKRFIDNLLSDVAKTPPPVTNLADVKYSLEEIQGQWFCKSYLSINSGIHRFERMGLLEEEYARLSSKLELYRSNGKTEIRVGYVFKVPAKKSIKIDELGDILLSKSALQNQNWSLFLLDPQAGETFEIPTNNVNLSITEEPLVFAQRNGRFGLLGSGTVRTKADLVRILVGENANVECEDFKEIGRIDDDTLVIEAQASCRVIIEKSIFQVALNAEEDHIRYEFRPNSNDRRLFLLPRLNKNVFIGFPRVYQVKGSSGRISRVVSGLEYYKDEHWQKVDSGVFGRIRVRLKTRDETHFVKTISVLPFDFSLDYKSGKKPAFDVKTESKLGLIVKSNIPSEIQESVSNTKTVTFHTSEYGEEGLPETCELVLKKQGFSRPISITIPFPRKKITFYDKESERISNDSYLYTNDVYGARLSLSNLIDHSQKYRVVLTLMNAANATGIRLNRAIELEHYQYRSIPLITFQHQWDRLFSLTASIDAYVQLEVGSNQIRISQVPNSRPIVDGNLVTISGDRQKGEIKITASPLDKPFKQESIVPLEYLEEEKTWKAPESEGVWLFFPSKDSVQFFRPIAHKKTVEGTIDVSK
ncbi:STY4851/ECs_5259 family protein, partial [Phaeodactylibacter xiamenensis]|uniref:STY4851/ECs_5259 family protein n=1 Tax=Phaeodactylibacter xiamenensis TaxID=1524460 RepID=UPI0024A8D3BB